MTGGAPGQLDRIQVVLVALLLGVGLLAVYSASAGDFTHQLGAAVLGVCAYAAAAAFDYRRLRRAALPLYLGCVLLLLAVHVFGHSALGARRWISLLGVPLEPSELAKMGLLVALAAWFDGRPSPTWLDTLSACALALGPAALILTQPDLGTTIVVVALLAGALFFGNARRRHLAALALMAAAVVPIVPNSLRGYQRRRLEIFLDPTQDPLGAGYNLVQARIAVGSGGLFGRGWLNGAQGRLGFVPERSTDFIFAVYAEQFGLFGCLLLLGLFCALLVRLAQAAACARDRFGYLLVTGVATMILVEVLENVGMNIGLTPIAGIPLPLVSYGGSAMLTNLCALGLVQSVVRRRRPATASEPRRVLLNESGTVRLQV